MRVSREDAIGDIRSQIPDPFRFVVGFHDQVDLSQVAAMVAVSCINRQYDQITLLDREHFFRGLRFFAKINGSLT